MALNWKKMNGRRHAVTNGVAICGERSIEQTGEALPCPECLEAVNLASKTAFAD